MKIIDAVDETLGAVADIYVDWLDAARESIATCTGLSMGMLRTPAVRHALEDAVKKRGVNLRVLLDDGGFARVAGYRWLARLPNSTLKRATHRLNHMLIIDGGRFARIEQEHAPKALLRSNLRIIDSDDKVALLVRQSFNAMWEAALPVRLADIPAKTNGAADVFVEAKLRNDLPEERYLREWQRGRRNNFSHLSASAVVTSSTSGAP